jgi:hypothetical protein
MKIPFFLVSVFLLVFVITGCQTTDHSITEYPIIDREERIPVDIAKRDPESDSYPPILHSNEFNQPIPLPFPVNTAGAEDSPFILPDGNTLYFFFTPNVSVPPEKSILDQVSGVWVTQKMEGGWDTPQRVWLQEPNVLALDGAVSIQGQEMWFATAREGYTGVNMFTAEWVDERWTRWEYVGDYLMKTVGIGEVHIHQDDLYFHANRPDGKGNDDIWVITRDGNNWSGLRNIEAVNTPESDSRPFITSDGSHLWFTRTYMGTPAVYRSVKQNGEWQSAELIISQFAGEPTLDDAGNLYFIHHYYENGIMIEADIYVAYKK